MNSFTKVLFSICVGFFILQVVLTTISEINTLNNAIFYSFSHIALMTTSLFIQYLKKDFFYSYLMQNIKNHRLLLLLVLIFIPAIVLLLMGKIDFLALLVWFYLSFSFVYILEGRLIAYIGMILLGYSGVMLILNEKKTAEALVIYAFIFIIITVFTQFREYFLDKKKSNE